MFEVTSLVVTVNAADVPPSGTVTDAGVVTASLLDAIDTSTPPWPAGPFNVTTADDLSPPNTEDGDKTTLSSIADGVITTDEVRSELPLADAVITAVVSEVTESVDTLNDTDVAPAAIVTSDGTLNDFSFDDIDTIIAESLASFIVTVPTEVDPPNIEASTDSKYKLGAAVTIRVSALSGLPDADAVIVTEDVTEVSEVIKKNVFVVEPAGTVTVPGHVATSSELAKLTTNPFSLAPPFNVIVPVDPDPPTTEFGLKDTLNIEADGVTVSVPLRSSLPSADAVITTSVIEDTSLVVIETETVV